MATASAQVSLPGFDGLYGLELVELAEDRARAKVVVRDELKQPLGVVHGGVYAAIADSLASTATARAVAGDDKLAVALALQTSFLRPISEGAVHAAAVVKHRGRTTWVWAVELSDDGGQLCALARITVAIRERPAS